MISTKKFTKREREVFWKKHVSTFHSSGLTQKAYCQDQELSYWTFNSWKNRLRKEISGSKLIELSSHIIPSILNKINSGDDFEIILKNNLKIRIPDNFDSLKLLNILNCIGGIL